MDLPIARLHLQAEGTPGRHETEGTSVMLPRDQVYTGPLHWCHAVLNLRHSWIEAELSPEEGNPFVGVPGRRLELEGGLQKVGEGLLALS